MYYFCDQVALAASDCLLVVESRDPLQSAKPKPHIETEEVVLKNMHPIVLHLAQLLVPFFPVSRAICEKYK